MHRGGRIDRRSPLSIDGLALAGRARASRRRNRKRRNFCDRCYSHGMRDASTEPLQSLAVRNCLFAQGRTALPTFHSASSIVPPPDLHRGKSRTIPR